MTIEQTSTKWLGNYWTLAVSDAATLDSRPREQRFIFSDRLFLLTGAMRLLSTIVRRRWRTKAIDAIGLPRQLNRK